MKKKTHDDFVAELGLINQNILVLEEYAGFKTKIKLKCKIDNHVWYQAPYRLLSGTGCPKCSGRAKKTDEEFKIEIAAINPDIDVLGEYTGALERINCVCKICNHSWTPFANSLVCGSGCSKCSRLKSRSTTERFLELFNRHEKSNSIELLSPFINYSTSIKCRCKIDGHEWDARPSVLVSGSGCPKCGGRLKLDNDDFIKRMSVVNPNILCIGLYINNHTKVKCKCLIDEHEWMSAPSNLLMGQGCPLCCTSKGEKYIIMFFDKYNIYYEYQKEFDGLVGLGGGNLSYDFYLPDQNILIEYQGQFHDGTARLQSKKKLQKQKIHDERKRSYALHHNIELLEIWYYDNVENVLIDLLYKEISKVG